MEEYSTAALPEAAVRAQLDAVLASETFRRVEGQSRLLRYIVERRLAGDLDSLKESVLGVEVFNRDAGFDPRADGVVRVEALRLRKRLDTYYNGDGRQAPVLILLPKGAYVPVFVSRDAPAAPRRSRRLWPAGLAMAAALGAAAWVAVGGTNWPKPRVGSLAVLPFLDLTGNPDNEYFDDGLVDELTAALSKLPSLRVAARTSAFAFRGKAADVREIGRRLAVDSLLEGSVRAEGEQLVVTVQLVAASDGYHLWSQTYRGGRNAVASMEDEMVRAIARTLKLSVEAAGPVYVPGEAARDLYWRARFVNRPTLANRTEAVRLLEQALALDPKYVDAWAALAAAHASLALHRDGPYPQVADKARDAIRRTLQLDPENATAHAALAAVLYSCDWDWPAAEAEFRRALAANPNNSWAHHTFAFALMLHGRFAEALTENHQARLLDPLSHALETDLAVIYFGARRYEDAVRELRAALNADKEFLSAEFLLGPCLSAMGRHDEALATFEKMLRRVRYPSILGRYGAALAKAGKRTEALQILHEILTGPEASGAPPVYAGYIYAALGENDKALDCLEQSFAARDTDLLMLAVDPAFDNLRGDPRFMALKQKLGL